MTYYSTNEFRSGIKIILDGEPCAIINNEFIKPGKGQAFNRVRLRKLISGQLLDKIFKSGDLVEVADVIDVNLNYLYNEGELWYFINNTNFEQIAVNKKTVGKNAKWLVTQAACLLTIWNDQPISVTLPNFIELKIINTDISIKGETANTSYKPAILATGAVIKVPLFIQNGDLIKVDTRSGEYVSRVK
ncbi:elongation factor P [Candidatus Palibaumannia cicadellinicola]|uniref:Elongation factor P n=1 Tax=Candidatus Palibaumannia cicadellinicola TaxID=186490 RepID=A0A0K2BL54_9GAMM|nr:elongation factor P [Candidatus Baumannia cicadellinicola]AKZ66116.1 Translation elongation factor P [Candidatus Baumannia cicadellinicola]